MRNKPYRKDDRLIEVFMTEVLVFIKQTFPFPRLVKIAVFVVGPLVLFFVGLFCLSQRYCPKTDLRLRGKVETTADYADDTD